MEICFIGGFKVLNETRGWRWFVIQQPTDDDESHLPHATQQSNCKVVYVQTDSRKLCVAQETTTQSTQFVIRIYTKVGGYTCMDLYHPQ